MDNLKDSFVIRAFIKIIILERGRVYYIALYKKAFARTICYAIVIASFRSSLYIQDLNKKWFDEMMSYAFRFGYL